MKFVKEYIIKKMQDFMKKNIKLKFGKNYKNIKNYLTQNLDKTEE